MAQSFIYHKVIKRKGSVPYLSDVVHIQANRSSFVIKYKTSYKEEDQFKTMDVLLKIFKKTGAFTLPQPYITPKGFPKEKKDEIIKKLEPIIPANRMVFWRDLPERE